MDHIQIYLEMLRLVIYLPIQLPLENLKKYTNLMEIIL